MGYELTKKGEKLYKELGSKPSSKISDEEWMRYLVLSWVENGMDILHNICYFGKTGRWPLDAWEWLLDSGYIREVE